MQRLTGVTYDNKPNDVTVTPTMVDVVVKCEAVTIKDAQDGKEYAKFKCDINRYTTDEYIDVLSHENVTLSEQVTQTQLALVEVFELIMG